MAFHPYPRVIPPVFNLGGFGPPRGLTPASVCPWVAHPASRLQHTTKRHLKGSLSLRLVSKLNLAAHRNSLAHSTKGTPSRLTPLRPLVSTRFQVLFHSPLGVLFTFPSRYWFAIGLLAVFSLGGWSRRTQDSFHAFHNFTYGTLTPYGWPSQTIRLSMFSHLAMSDSLRPH